MSVPIAYTFYQLLVFIFIFYIYFFIFFLSFCRFVCIQYFSQLSHFLSLSFFYSLYLSIYPYVYQFFSLLVRTSVRHPLSPLPFPLLPSPVVGVPASKYSFFYNFHPVSLKSHVVLCSWHPSINHPHSIKSHRGVSIKTDIKIKSRIKSKSKGDKRASMFVILLWWRNLTLIIHVFLILFTFFYVFLL